MKFLGRLTIAGVLGALFMYLAEQSIPGAIGALTVLVVFVGMEIEGKIKDLQKALEMHSKRVFPELWN